jgi:ribosome biogenesis GTPase
MTLQDLGWNEKFAEAFEPFRSRGLEPARLIRDNRITYGALLGDGEELEVVLGGKVYHDAATDAELPAVGDWVALELGGEGDETVIRARLPRQTCLSRRAPGNSAEEQVIVANVNVVLVVTEPGVDFNPRRLERYFAIISRSGAVPVVVVNKADLFPAQRSKEVADAVRLLQPGVEVYLTSAETGRGLSSVRSFFKRGVSVALIGSSGVGKSALVNRLLGDEYQWTGEVNETTGKGRHTTSARELMILPKGGILVDNPGIKEVQMWTDEATLREQFEDIDAIAARCRFSDCKHGSDAGCAIRASVEAGELEAARYAGYIKLESEIEALRRNRRKRQMTIERRYKRENRAKVRNPEDRQEFGSQMKPW